MLKNFNIQLLMSKLSKMVMPTDLAAVQRRWRRARMANSMHTNRNRCENLGSSGNRAMQLKNFSNFLLLSN